VSSDFIKDRLRRAKLAERTVPICLSGDLVAEFEAAERALVDAQRKNTNSLAGDGTGDILDRMSQLQEQMRDDTEIFRLRAMPKAKFRALVAAHPPRRTDDGQDVDERDKFIGVNTETFFDALIRASVVEPVLDDEDWRVLLGDDEDEQARIEAEGEPVEDGKLTDKQFDTLSDVAWYLNRGDVNIPFSPAASRMSRSSETE
jgi:hypothetical protein